MVYYLIFDIECWMFNNLVVRHRDLRLKPFDVSLSFPFNAVVLPQARRVLNFKRRGALQTFMSRLLHYLTATVISKLAPVNPPNLLKSKLTHCREPPEKHQTVFFCNTAP